jgi:uncharacterized membrane protein
LERDLAAWRAAGLISADTEAAIRAEVAARRRGLGLSGVLGLLGAVLIGFAAMSFVAANWQDMSKLSRIALLLGGLWAAYGAAGVLFRRNLPGFAHAAVLLGVALFGASIMLVAQMYHIDGHPPDAVLTWAAGALLAGVAVASNPTLGLAMLLVALWSGWETVLTGVVHWPFLLAWAAVAIAIAWRRWEGGLYSPPSCSQGGSSRSATFSTKVTRIRSWSHWVPRLPPPVSSPNGCRGCATTRLRSSATAARLPSPACSPCSSSSRPTWACRSFSG